MFGYFALLLLFCLLALFTSFLFVRWDSKQVNKELNESVESDSQSTQAQIVAVYSPAPFEPYDEEFELSEAGRRLKIISKENRQQNLEQEIKLLKIKYKLQEASEYRGALDIHTKVDVRVSDKPLLDDL